MCACQFDKGLYEVKTDSPHVPAGLLKMWLRELQDPLIPDNLYQACVDCASADVPELKQALQVYQQLPQLNKSIIEHLAGMLAEICANSQQNLMTVENLAIVFSPSFLR